MKKLQKRTLGEKVKTIGWAFGIAWGIDKAPVIIWYGLSVILAALPAVTLRYNKMSLAVISGFLSGGSYTYDDIVRPVVFLGIFMTLVAISLRINKNLIYMMMYDAYYCGMQELLMDGVQRVKMTELMKKEINDVYNYSLLRAGSLTDLISGACAIVGKLVSIISLLIVAYASSKPIFFISSIYVVSILVLNFLFTEKTRSYAEDSFDKNRLAEYYEKLSDDKGIAKEVRLFENTDDIVETWREPYHKFQVSEGKRAYAAELQDFIGGAGFYLFLIIATGISIFGVARGSVKPDAFLLLFTLCLNIYSVITGTAGSIYGFDSGLYALERQRKFFELARLAASSEERGRNETAGDENVVFRAEHLWFSYVPDKPVIKDVSFTINKGEIVALVGQNGSGKSTLVKLLLNMYSPSSGTLEAFGRPFKDYKTGFIRKRIGVFFQDFYLFHLTLRENVGFGSIEELDDEGKIRAALRKGGAEKLAEKLPKGLDTLLGKFMDKSGTELSGGEKQRVGVSRAHMSDREVLVFDEPASMLDPLAEMEQFLNIKEKIEGRTAILISHRIGFARLADKIIMMDNGEVAECGKHDELISKNGLYKRFFNEQAQWYKEEGADAGKAVAI